MPGYTIDMINVGQGDAFLVASGGVTCLVDAGSSHGGTAVANHIKRHFGGRLTYALLSHVDDDHIAGLAKVLEAGIRPRRVYFNDPAAAFGEVLRKATEGYGELLEKQAAVELIKEDIRKIAAADEGMLLLASVQTHSRIKELLDAAQIPQASAFAGLSIALGSTTDLHVLSPAESEYPAFVADFTPRNRAQLHDLLEKAAKGSAENASSVIIEVRSTEKPEDNALLTGDADPATLAAVAGRRYRLVKIPHHGSSTTFDAALLDNWQPSAVALSHGSRYGHPSSLWMDELRGRGIAVFCSKCQGTLRFHRAGATRGAPWKRIESECHCGEE